MTTDTILVVNSLDLMADQEERRVKEERMARQRADREAGERWARNRARRKYRGGAWARHAFGG